MGWSAFGCGAHWHGLPKAPDAAREVFSLGTRRYHCHHARGHGNGRVLDMRAYGEKGSVFGLIWGLLWLLLGLVGIVFAIVKVGIAGLFDAREFLGVCIFAILYGALKVSLQMPIQVDFPRRRSASAAKNAAAVKIDEPMCIGCGLCVDECREGVLAMSDGMHAAVVDPAACDCCGACVQCCPADAIIMP